MKLLNVLILFITFSTSLFATDYYVSTEGNDANDGLSMNTAWKSLAKVNAAAERDNKGGYLQAGDKVLFRKGDTFKGQLKLWRSGTLANPIVISSYGEGDFPILTGVGANLGNNNNGDAIEVVIITNASHLLLTELWITNNRVVDLGWQGSGNSSYGIVVKANKWGGISQGLTFRNLKFTDIFGVDMIDWEGKFTRDYYKAQGFFFDSEADDGSTKVGINDVLIEDCYFYNLGSTGVSIRNLNTANNPISEEGRNQNFIIRNNTFEKLGGDGVVFASVCNGLVENNEFIDLGWGDHTSSTDRYFGRGEGCWIWDSHNIIVQYNKQYRASGFGDTYGAAGHIDFFCKNAIFQYNYSEHTEGGFVEILGDCHNSVFRYNVSVNDGHRANGHHRYSIWLSGYVGKDIDPVPSDENYIYNNTIYLDDVKSKPDISIFAKNTYIYNNIFQAINGAQIGAGGVEIDMQDGAELVVSNNLFDGDIADAFKNLDENKVIGNPEFTNPVTADGEKVNFNIETSSKAIDRGLKFEEPVFPMAGQGIFKDITSSALSDVFGTAVDIRNNVPNIGASNAHNDESATDINTTKRVDDIFNIYPNPVKNILHINMKNDIESGAISIYSVSGDLVKKIDSDFNMQRSQINLPSSIQNGIYYLKVGHKATYQVERFIVCR